jgi:hypothetical protein
MKSRLAKVANRLGVCLLCLFLVGLVGEGTCQDKAIFLVREAEKFGYMNKRGRIIIRPHFEAAGKFYEGLARILVGSNWGYTNRRGRIIISPQFEAAGDFSEGLASIQINGKHGYIDPIFDGLALMETSYGLAYIDKRGNHIWREKIAHR